MYIYTMKYVCWCRHGYLDVGINGEYMLSLSGRNCYSTSNNLALDQYLPASVPSEFYTSMETKQWIDLWLLFTIAYLIIQPYGAMARYIKRNAKWILKLTERLLLLKPHGKYLRKLFITELFLHGGSVNWGPISKWLQIQGEGNW